MQTFNVQYSDGNLRSNYQFRVVDWRTGPVPPGADPRFFLLFLNLSCTAVSPQSPSTWVRTVVPITRRDFIGWDEAHQRLREALSTWPIHDSHLHSLIGYALERAAETVASMPAGDGIVDINIHIEATHSLVYGEDVDETEDDFMDEYQVRMIPTQDSSIEALVRDNRTTVPTESETCSICQEDLVRGSEAISMPCRHLFHQDCILQWLRTSHHCPLCRFEMPTS